MYSSYKGYSPTISLVWGLSIILGGFKVKVSLVPASAAPRGIVWQPKSLLPGQRFKGRARVSVTELFIGSLGLQK